MQFPLRSVFLAIPLEGDARRTFVELQERLQPFADCLSFQDPRTPHLTLQFWKEVMTIEWEPIRQSTARIAAAHHSFSLPVLGAETFGHRGEDRVLFLSLAFSDELARLRKACPWPSEQPFHPHVTLARIRHPQRFAASRKKIFKVLEHPGFSLSVDRLRLYAEIDGQAQTPIEEWGLSEA